MEAGTNAGQSPIGIVVAAHAPLASALLDTVQRILADRGPTIWDGVDAVDISQRIDTAQAFDGISAAVASVDRGAGVLVLADLFGGTAANLALAQLGDERVEVVTGVNLAMILEAVVQRQREGELDKLALRVADAAEGSVVVASALLSGRSDEDDTDSLAA